MKKVLKAFVVMLLMATILNASSLKESLKVDGYNLELTSKRDLSAGSNEFFVKITKDGAPADLFGQAAGVIRTVLK